MYPPERDLNPQSQCSSTEKRSHLR